MADARLAGTSLAQLLFLTLIAAFASIAVWVGIISLIATALLKAGVSWMVVGSVFVLLHVIVLVAAALGIKSCSEGLNFTASRKLLSSTAGSRNQNEIRRRDPE